MTEVEREFLRRMDVVVTSINLWESERTNARSTRFTSVAAIIKAQLLTAARALSLFPRFNVFCRVNEDGSREVEIIPMNEQADHMMARYRELYVEYELSQG